MGICKIRKKWGIDYYFQGRRIREVVGTNRRQAERALASRKGEIVQGKFSLEKIKPTPYFEDFSEEYLEWAKVNHRSWERMDQWCIKKLKGFLGRRRLGEITTWLIEKYKAQRKDEVASATINRDLSVLSSMLSRAIEWGRLIDHPMKGGRVKKFREESLKERILSEEEEGTLISVCSGWFKDMVIVALDTGMRLSELMNLKWEEVDFNRGEVAVRNTKSGKDRRIPLTERVMSVLKERRENNGTIEYVFPRAKGKQPWRVRSAFVRACEKASIKGLRFHDLRHTCATRLVTGGVDLATVQKFIGHQDVRMTLRYSHPSSEEMKKAVRVLEEKAGSSQQMDTIEKMRGKVKSITS